MSPISLYPSLSFIPRRVFFTAGTGQHELERVAMQHAMREAGVSQCNLVKVSSILPPETEIIPRASGIRLLRPGNIVFAVIAQSQTNEPHQRITPAVAWANPDKKGIAGYIAEVEEDLAKGKTEETAADEAGEEAVTILAETLRVRVDPKRKWNRRKRTTRIGRTNVGIGYLAATTEGPEEKDGRSDFAAAIVLAVFV
ncbi:MAG TPA: pyruvoyl-dependent arginine decarboxylase [Gemmatimonadaceae bacterium]|nr:pyruvoyl-dependent arginine decarboxylase [Gemmatimonadaceae bacterium]